MLERVQYIPTYARDYAYIVANCVDDELFFWGAWNDRNKAQAVAEEIGGIVVEG